MAKAKFKLPTTKELLERIKQKKKKEDLMKKAVSAHIEHLNDTSDDEGKEFIFGSFMPDWLRAQIQLIHQEDDQVAIIHHHFPPILIGEYCYNIGLGG